VKVSVMTATIHNPFDESHSGEPIAGKSPDCSCEVRLETERFCSIPRQSLYRNVSDATNLVLVWSDQDTVLVY
jgi:hypothetical protein